MTGMNDAHAGKHWKKFRKVVEAAVTGRSVTKALNQVAQEEQRKKEAQQRLQAQQEAERAAAQKAAKDRLRQLQEKDAAQELLKMQKKEKEELDLPTAVVAAGEGTSLFLKTDFVKLCTALAAEEDPMERGVLLGNFPGISSLRKDNPQVLLPGDIRFSVAREGKAVTFFMRLGSGPLAELMIQIEKEKHAQAQAVEAQKYIETFEQVMQALHGKMQEIQTVAAEDLEEFIKAQTSKIPALQFVHFKLIGDGGAGSGAGFYPFHIQRTAVDFRLMAGDKLNARVPSLVISFPFSLQVAGTVDLPESVKAEDSDE